MLNGLRIYVNISDPRIYYMQTFIEELKFQSLAGYESKVEILEINSKFLSCVIKNHITLPHSTLECLI